MCHAYPECSHKGNVMEKLGSLVRKCETADLNSECQYLKLGCLGCTFKKQEYTRYSHSQYMSIKGLNLP